MRFEGESHELAAAHIEHRSSSNVAMGYREMLSDAHPGLLEFW